MIKLDETNDEDVIMLGMQLLKSVLISTTDETCFMNDTNLESYALCLQYLLPNSINNKSLLVTSIDHDINSTNSTMDINMEQVQREDFYNIVDWLFAFNMLKEETIGSVLNCYGQYLMRIQHPYQLFDIIARNRHSFDSNIVDLTLCEDILVECSNLTRDLNQWDLIYRYRKEWLVELFERYDGEESALIDLATKLCFDLIRSYSTSVDESKQCFLFTEDVLELNNEEQNQLNTRKYIEKVKSYSIFRTTREVRMGLLELLAEIGQEDLISPSSDDQTAIGEEESTSKIMEISSLPQSNRMIKNSIDEEDGHLTLISMIEHQREEIEQCRQENKFLEFQLRQQQDLVLSLMETIKSLISKTSENNSEIKQIKEEMNRLTNK